MQEWLLICLSGMGSAVIPQVAFQYTNYKNERRGKEKVQSVPSRQMMLLCGLAGAALAGLAAYSLPFWRASFCVVFIWFAAFGICVDGYIRIIGNEMLLAMLIVGISYRMVDGGLSSFAGSLLALLLTIALFAAAAGITYLRRMSGGVGMGDVKLAMVIAITAGWPGTMYFLGGMAAAMILYIAFLFFRKRFFLKNTFPMCGPLMFGLLTALYQPLVDEVLNVLL